jgi:hypothetical protein
MAALRWQASIFSVAVRSSTLPFVLVVPSVVAASSLDWRNAEWNGRQSFHLQ